MAIKVECYGLFYNSDGNEGRGHEVLYAYFKSRKLAEEVCRSPEWYKKYGVMGSSVDPEYAIKSFCITVYESKQDYEDGKKVNIREQALSKLSLEEKIALGLVR